MIKTMLTTIDNPYDPFTEFSKWYTWDLDSGYHTCAFLARIYKSSSELSIADQELALDQAIEEIVEENVTGMYRIATRDISAIENQ